MSENGKPCDACDDERARRMTKSRSLCQPGDGPDQGCPAPIDMAGMSSSYVDLTDRLNQRRKRRSEPARPRPARKSRPSKTRPGVPIGIVIDKATGRELDRIELMPWTIERLKGDEAEARGDKAGAKRHLTKSRKLYDAEVRRQKHGVRFMASFALDHELAAFERDTADVRVRMKAEDEARRRARRIDAELRITKEEIER